MVQREAGKHGRPRDVPWVCFLLHSTHTCTIPTFTLISGFFYAFLGPIFLKQKVMLSFAFLHFCTKETIVIIEEVFFGIANPINEGAGVLLE